MSHDFELGFRNKPSDLAEILEAQGFALRQTAAAEPGDFERRKYSWFDEQKSRKGVWIIYIEGLYGDEEELFEIEPNLAAQAMISTYMGRNDFDMKKQNEIVRFLRDHYGAALYDLQEGEEIKN